MIVSLVLAVSENGVIGKDNQLPWRLSADLRHFRKITTGNTVIMGRKTYDSIGKPLKNRRNIVISRNTSLEIEGCEVMHSLVDALKTAIGEDEVFVIGGSTIYQKAIELDIADRIYMTVVHGDFEGDTFFSMPEDKIWLEKSRVRHKKDEKNEWDYSFLVKERR